LNKTRLKKSLFLSLARFKLPFEVKMMFIFYPNSHALKIKLNVKKCKKYVKY